VSMDDAVSAEERDPNTGSDDADADKDDPSDEPSDDE